LFDSILVASGTLAHVGECFGIDGVSALGARQRRIKRAFVARQARAQRLFVWCGCRQRQRTRIGYRCC
jgi:hypothetical protein